MKRSSVFLWAVFLSGVCVVTGFGQNVVSDIGPELAEIRQSTAQYHDVENALADGYIFYPVAGNPGGVDMLLINFGAAYDMTLRLDQPEGLGYVFMPNGKPLLASVFFFLPFPASAEPPTWLGYEMDANVGAGVWEMEAWVWVNNPDGIFSYVNPRFLEDWY